MARIKIFDSASKTWIYADHAFGKDGADGKSAYEYAKDAGFTGTEAEFAQKLIEEKVQVQSNWTQNDPSAVDYIRGRTHSAIWSEGVIFDGVLEPESLDSMDFAADFDFSNFLMLHAGAEYNITIDGQNYVSTLKFYSMGGMSAYIFGNVGIMIPGLPVSEEPFVIMLIPNSNAISLMMLDGSLAPGVQKAMTISGDFIPYVTEDGAPGDFFIERLDKSYLPTEIAALPEACDEMWYDIDDLKRNLDSKVSYAVSQSLSDSQKAQARQNIGAVSAEEISSMSGNLATQHYVDNKIAHLVNSAPETLDTLGELATAMEQNESVVNALNQAIANKADNSTVTQLQETVNAKAENSALNEHTSNTTIHITAVERAAWNSKMDGDSELISIADIDTICGSVIPIAEVLF